MEPAVEVVTDVTDPSWRPDRNRRDATCHLLTLPPHRKLMDDTDDTGFPPTIGPDAR